MPFIVVFYVATKMGAIIVPNVVSVEKFGYFDVHISDFIIFKIIIFDKMWGCDFSGVAVISLFFACGF